MSVPQRVLLLVLSAGFRVCHGLEVPRWLQVSFTRRPKGKWWVERNGVGSRDWLFWCVAVRELPFATLRIKVSPNISPQSSAGQGTYPYGAEDDVRQCRVWVHLGRPSGAQAERLGCYGAALSTMCLSPSSFAGPGT